MNNDLAAIHAHLDLFPEDWETRLILADLYEDLGDTNRSEMQKWLVKYEKRPCSPELRIKFWLTLSENEPMWTWYGGGEIDPKSAISSEFYGSTSFTSRQEAEEDLMWLLDKHPEKFSYVPRKTGKYAPKRMDGLAL
jgi:hypothetical protein